MGISLPMVWLHLPFIRGRIFRGSGSFKIIETSRFLKDFRPSVVFGRLLLLLLVLCMEARSYASFWVCFSLSNRQCSHFFLGAIDPSPIFGLMHRIGQAETQKIYRNTYPRLDADLSKLHDNPGLMTLLVDNLVDLEFISKEVELTLDVEKEDVESTRQLIDSESGSRDQTRAS